MNSQKLLFAVAFLFACQPATDDPTDDPTDTLPPDDDVVVHCTMATDAAGEMVTFTGISVTHGRNSRHGVAATRHRPTV